MATARLSSGASSANTVQPPTLVFMLPASKLQRASSSARMALEANPLDWPSSFAVASLSARLAWAAGLWTRCLSLACKQRPDPPAR